jgi:pyruvate formate-lyase activating enzyme-like uncharacterized protein
MENEFSELSKGCRLCQQGKWLCIYITYKCTAGCPFCPSPFHDDRIFSSFGNNKENILEYLKIIDFGGISFSGGDPFLVFDRMYDWLIFFKKHLPKYYYWVYTNGLAVDEDKLEKLAIEGMDEIRFNIAATDYMSPTIWEKIKKARKNFSYVTIEIPSIKNDYRKLIEALDKAEEIGIDYLNLHDYILSAHELKTTREPVNEFLLNKTNVLRYLVSSVENTNKIAGLINSQDYHFHINHCSMEQKEGQMLQRRFKMRSVFNKKEIDTELDAGLVCNYYQFPGWFNDKMIEKILFDLDSDNKKESFIKLKHEIDNWTQKPGFKLVQVRYVPQMEVDGDKILVDWQVIKC